MWPLFNEHNENDEIFYIPTNEKSLVTYALRHLEYSIDFSINGIVCPEPGCQDSFPDTDVLYSHILNHKNLMFICHSCFRAFSNEETVAIHFKNDHHLTIFSMDSLINIAEILAIRLNEKKYWPVFHGSPTLAMYSDTALVFTICQFPQTAKFLRTKYDVTLALQHCYETGPIIYRTTMRCYYAEFNDPCGREFNNCRELVFHLTTHFGICAICKYCLQIFDVADDAVSLHMANVHNECSTCGYQFPDMNAHKSVIEALSQPYTIPSVKIDVNCALYFGNFAFHHCPLVEVENNLARRQKHICLTLSTFLWQRLNEVDYAPQIHKRMQKCLMKAIVKFSEQQQCHCDGCSFKYIYCREILVHMFLVHSTFRDFTYICNFCMVSYGEQNQIRNHLKSIHSSFITCQTCFLSFETKLKLSYHQHSTGHLTK